MVWGGAKITDAPPDSSDSIILITLRGVAVAEDVNGVDTNVDAGVSDDGWFCIC